MMRAPSRWAVAVRRPDDIIEVVRHELPRLSERSPAAKIPFMRGVLVLIESLTLGFKALSWSAQKSGDEDEQITKLQTTITMIVAVIVALAIFIFIPVLIADFLKEQLGGSSLFFVVLDGVIRIAMIVFYIWAISRSKEIQRVFQYHGAEHKTIHAYEAGDPLTVAAVQEYSPRHPRCGTSFLLIVGMVAFFVFLLLAPLAFWWQVAARILLIPVIAGISYELLKAGATSRWMSWANRPGIWLQSITTKEPEDKMVEVAVASLLGALTEDEVVAVKERGPVAPGALAAEVDVPEAIDG
jgi:uncharacterized protein YqhQ